MAERICLRSIRINASTVCQLKCPLCLTAKGIIRKELKDGFLSFGDFKKLVDENPRIAHIELSNRGEIFLNSQIYEIIEYAYQKSIVLTAMAGANLNTVNEKVLESLVKYKFFSMICSIDGTSQETYGTYRIGGNLAQVIENIKIINFYKAKYRSFLPRLKWQFIVFGHNEHEIKSARALAKKLRMVFWLRLNRHENYFPVKNKDLVRSETILGVASRREFHEKYGWSHMRRYVCSQLWNSPQINWDGRILGCCCNYRGDLGNIFVSGKENSLNSEKMEYARQMLLGTKAAREGIPCTTCRHYKRMQEDLTWVTRADIWNRWIMKQLIVFSLIHILGWKRAGRMPNIIGSIGNLF